MDRNYCYRILRLTEEATSEQIKQAYDARMAKLNSDDYKDDPEYVAKKKEQIIEAYKVLTGSVPPAAKEQGKARFEKFKDYIEKDQDGEKKRIGSYQPFGRKRYTPDKKLGFAITIIAVAVIVIAVVAAVIFAAGKFAGDFDFQSDNVGNSLADEDNDDYDGFDMFVDSYDADDTFNGEAKIDEARQMIENVDFYSGLDFSSISYNEDETDLDCGVGFYGGSGENGELDETANNTLSLLFSLGIYGAADFFEYVTGEEQFYFDYDDYDCAVVLINWLGAPDFEDTAGCINMYSGEPILTIADYLSYLESAINEEQN